jgi:hypothetical protein
MDTTMLTMRNLTLHEQGPAECALAAQSGFALRPEPEGVMVGPGEEGLEAAARALAKRLRECAERSEAVLVGGHTGVWIRAVLQLTEQAKPLPELYYFDTRRSQDENGRFVFAPERLVRIPQLRGR